MKSESGDCGAYRTSLLNALVDGWSCEELPDGRAVVSLPFTHSDGDNVEVLVSRLEGGVLSLSDWGSSAERLRLAGVNLEAQRAIEEVSLLVREFGVRLGQERELELEVAQSDVGQALVTLSAAMLQLGGLSALRQGEKPSTFSSRLGRWLETTLPGRVRRSPRVTGRRGKRHTVTAAVQPIEGDEVFLQAVAPAETRDRSLDHAFKVVYDLNDRIPAERTVVVLAGQPDAYDAADLAGLMEFSYVATWWQQDEMLQHLENPKRAASRALYVQSQGTFD